MTITPSIDLAVRKDVEQDGQTDRRKDGAPARDGTIVVLANHKGGVTKTTSTANLGAMIAEAGRQILMVDCDPQANLSEAFGWGEERPGERLEDLLARPEVAFGFTPPIALGGSVTASPTWRERLRIIACTDALADLAADLPHTAGPGYETRLRDVLAPLRSRFDVILLDTPPGLGNLSGMAMLAADRLLIPRSRPTSTSVAPASCTTSSRTRSPA